MASGILGLGSSGSVDLSSELITKLKTAESTSILDPITTQKENTQAQIDATDEIQTKILELLEISKIFDLYTSDTNVFDEITASTTGTSATFDATDTSKLSSGITNVNITQLAQKDVYQSNIISDKTETLESGTLSIKVGEKSYDFSTEGKTYESLVKEMSYYSDFNVTLEQVGDSSYRIIVKSASSGEFNSVSIEQNSIDLGLNEESNHVLNAQNMKATIDGIDYDLSSNKITLSNGLSITANIIGESSITMEKDNSAVTESIENLATKYNELVTLINSYTQGDEDNSAIISDSSTLKTMMNTIKEILFGSYGLKNEENLFKYGISFDKYGYMQLDNSELSKALTNNYDDLKELFVGYAEKEGIGTKLKTYLDSLDSLDGLLTTYEDKLNNRLDTLKDEYETASDKLDEKYEQMSSQFASYTVLITQMENSFASLKQIIADSSDS